MEHTPRLKKGIAAIVVGVAMMIGGALVTTWGVKTVREELRVQAQSIVTGTDHVQGEGIKLASAREVGVWHFTHRAKDGSVIAKWDEHNTLSRIADQRMLENMYRGGAAAGASFYLGLADSTASCSIAKTDSTATVWGYGETSANGYSRQAVAKDGTAAGWPTSAASGNDWHIVSKVVTFTSTGTIGPNYCAVLTDQASGTAGDWYAWVALSQARTLANGESLDVSMDITLQ